MKVIYVAGPFRAANGWEIEQNIRHAEEVALELWRLGAAVICPHANTRFYQGVLLDQAWIEGDLEILKRCDAILMLERWRESIGSCVEYELALESPRIAILYENEWDRVIKWVQGGEA